MVTTDNNIDALLELDRFVRLLAASSGTTEIVAVVRAYLATWSIERITRLQATDAGWAPFDEYQQPFTITAVSDVRQLRSSIRIRCRELEASDLWISPEILELDLFFYFVIESLEVHEPKYPNSPVPIMPVSRDLRPPPESVPIPTAPTPRLVAWQ